MENLVNSGQQTYFDERFSHLRTLSQQAETGAWQYLLAVNGGGAAAMLAFIGAVPGYRSAGLSYIVLGAFVIGLLLVGGALVYQNIRIDRALKGWNSDMPLFICGKMTWLEMLERDHLRTDASWVPWGFGYGSIGLFLFGVVMVAYLFWRHVPYACIG